MDFQFQVVAGAVALTTPGGCRSRCGAATVVVVVDIATPRCACQGARGRRKEHAVRGIALTLAWRWLLSKHGGHGQRNRQFSLLRLDLDAAVGVLKKTTRRLALQCDASLTYKQTCTIGRS